MKTSSNIFLVFSLLILVSCERFVEIDKPRTDLVRSTVFASEETANAAVLNMYYQMQILGSFASGGDASVSLLCALSSDEGTNRQPSFSELQAFNANELLATNPRILSIWSDLYKIIYKANSCIEGLSASTTITPSAKDQLMGEALFVRSFAYFYLVNMFGDVPLVLTTDYSVNQNIARTGAVDVYTQIKKDLNEAKMLMVTDYSYAKQERVRPNSFVASALLARVYLYNKEWQNAEVEASSVINSPLYQLTDLESVFLKNSSEAILQLIPLFNAPADQGTAIALCAPSASLIPNFSIEDQRGSLWLDAGSANKYRSDGTDLTEYSMILRVSEQYLIRAEARAELNKLSASAEDVNMVRTRADLDEVNFQTLQEALSEIEQQRKLELFMEWGHRWLDLKRWGKANSVLSSIKSNWSANDELYPIPETQILNDPAMRNAQNPGY
jgi:hypothetical protein